MILYFRPLACSLACRIAAIEADLDIEFKEVELHGTKIIDNDADFLNVSMKGKVPVLLHDNGTELTENAAVLQFMADKTSKLAHANDSVQRYALQEALSFVGSELHKGILYPLFQPDTPIDVKEHIKAKAPRILNQLSHMLKDKEWMTGDHFTVADAYLIWALYLLRFAGFRLDEVTESYFKRASVRPSVAKAFEIEMGIWQRQQSEKQSA